MKSKKRDDRYLKTLIDPIRVCASYRPKMGQGADAGLSLEQFQNLYRADPFYAWYGLDHPMMYAAHKAAGGMTSIYRQIGIGAERLFRLSFRTTLACQRSSLSGRTKQSRRAARYERCH